MDSIQTFSIENSNFGRICRQFVSQNLSAGFDLLFGETITSSSGSLDYICESDSIFIAGID